jgi:hypothetical protein
MATTTSAVCRACGRRAHALASPCRMAFDKPSFCVSNIARLCNSGTLDLRCFTSPTSRMANEAVNHGPTCHCHTELTRQYSAALVTVTLLRHSFCLAQPLIPQSTTSPGRNSKQEQVVGRYTAGRAVWPTTQSPGNNCGRAWLRGGGRRSTHDCAWRALCGPYPDRWALSLVI